MILTNKQILQTCCCALLTVVLLAACSKKDDAQLVRDAIKKGAESAEQKRIAELLEHASDAFIARPGGYNKKTVKGVLFVALRRYGHFEIHYPRPAVSIESDGKGASAKVYFMIVRKDRAIPGLRELYENPQGWLEAVGEKADLYELALQWVKVDGTWLVSEANLKGVGRRRSN